MDNFIIVILNNQIPLSATTSRAEADAEVERLRMSTPMRDGERPHHFYTEDIPLLPRTKVVKHD